MNKKIKPLFSITTAILMCLSYSLYGQSNQKIIEIPLEKLAKKLKGLDNIIVKTNSGEVLTCQITYQNTLLIKVPEESCSIQKFYIGQGLATPDTTTCGAYYPERMDDIAWENNLMAFRTYGPALQRSGERAYGYDVWTKSVPYPIVKERYDNHLNKGISYHIDHGNGMDVYAVGPTLGAGTAALYINNQPLFPYCWESYQILDNGPLRFTVQLTYPEFELDGSTIYEVRTITLDHGSYLNKTSVEYKGLHKEMEIATGIIVHKSNPDGYTIDTNKRYITVEDSTQSRGNGAIYIGISKQKPFKSSKFLPIQNGGDNFGHALLIDTIAPNEKFDYFWGASWSKNGMTKDAWEKYIQSFHKKNQTNKRYKIKIKPNKATTKE